jgi:uncharacterized lipoprotein
MKRWWLLAGAVALLAGCQTNPKADRADLPIYDVQEQARRARERYSLPESDFVAGPQTFLRYGPTGRD